MHYAFPADERGNPGETAGCEITTDHGLCSGSVVTTAPYTGADTISYSNYGKATISFSNYGTEIGAQVVTITAGAAPGVTGSSTSIASTSATTTSAQASQIVSSSGSSSSTGSGLSTGSSSSSKVSTGGVSMIISYAQWVIGGAAAVVAIAAI
jgi:hypothetical protein